MPELEGITFNRNMNYCRINGVDFPHLITTNNFGDCGKSDPAEQVGKIESVRRFLGADKVLKIIPEQSKNIVEEENTPGIRYKAILCDSLICHVHSKYMIRPMLTIATGDCPIVMIRYNNNNYNRLIAMVHCGSQGVEKNLIEATLHKLETDCAVRINKLEIGIWPGICGRCYLAGPNHYNNGLVKYIENGRLNLLKIIIKQIQDCWVDPNEIKIHHPPQIMVCSMHSRHKSNYLFASFRRTRNWFRNIVALSF